MKSRICTKCGVQKETEQFSRCGGQRRRGMCKTCSNAIMVIKRAADRARLIACIEESDSLRICVACGDDKPIEEFPYRVKGGGVRRGTCHSCIEVRRREYRARRSYLDGNLGSKTPAVSKPDPAVVAAVKWEGLHAMLDKPKVPPMSKDPIAQAKVLYDRAWLSVQSIPRMIDSPIRGFMYNI